MFMDDFPNVVANESQSSLKSQSSLSITFADFSCDNHRFTELVQPFPEAERQYLE